MQRLATVKNHLPLSRGMLDADQVLKEWRGNCFKIILNRPKQYNAITGITHLELLKAIEEANNSAKICILTSTLAGKVFCAGGDVKALVQLFMNEAVDPLIIQGNKTMLAMANAKPITIAFWDGIVMGGGVGISVNFDIKIATENTAFGMPEAKLGFFSDVGAAYFLPRLKKNIGLFLAMTSYSLKGKQAYQAEVADYFVLSKNLPALEAEIEKLSLDPTLSEELIRETIKKYAEKIPKVYEGEDLIAEIFQGKDVSEVLEKLKQKSQENTTVKKWYGDILKNCPLSLFYNFESLKRGKTMNLHEALSMDCYLATKVNRVDFLEGVRTVLVEKGAKPNWSTTFEGLKTQKPEDYFPEKLALIDFESFKPSLEYNLAIIKKYGLND